MVELPVANVDGDHAGGTALQEAVGETAGRGADVEDVGAGCVPAEVLQHAVKLVAGAGDEARQIPYGELVGRRHLLARRPGRLAVDGDEPGENPGLGLRAGRREPTGGERLIEAFPPRSRHQLVRR